MTVSMSQSRSTTDMKSRSQRHYSIANECPHQRTPVHPLRTGPLYAAQAHVPHDSPPARVYRHTVHPAQLCSRHNMSARRKRRPSPSLYSVSSDELESDSMEFRWDELHVCGVRFIEKSPDMGVQGLAKRSMTSDYAESRAWSW